MSSSIRVSNVVIVDDTSRNFGGTAKVAYETARVLSARGINVVYFAGYGPADDRLSNVEVMEVREEPFLDCSSKVCGAVPPTTNSGSFYAGSILGIPLFTCIRGLTRYLRRCLRHASVQASKPLSRCTIIFSVAQMADCTIMHVMICAAKPRVRHLACCAIAINATMLKNSIDALALPFKRWRCVSARLPFAICRNSRSAYQVGRGLIKARSICRIPLIALVRNSITAITMCNASGSTCSSADSTKRKTRNCSVERLRRLACRACCAVMGRSLSD